MNIKTLTLAGAALFLAAAPVAAKPAWLGEVPNASSCLVCHSVATGGAENLNSFGDDILANLANDLPDWAAVRELDSDGDGANNALELGDPCLEWSKGGTPATTEDITNPGNADETTARTADCNAEPDAGNAGGDTDAGGGGEEPSGGCAQTGATTFGLAGLALLLLRKKR